MNLKIRSDLDFSGEIVSLCKKYNINKTILANRTGLNPKTISRIFYNQNPRNKKEPYNPSVKTFRKIIVYIRDNYDSGIVIIEME